MVDYRPSARFPLVLTLLRNVEALSACRDRKSLPHLLLRAVAGLLGDDADVAVFSLDAQGEIRLRAYSGPNILDSASSRWPELLRTMPADGQLVLRKLRRRQCGALRLRRSELGGEQLILGFETHPAAGTVYSDVIVSLARIHDSQLGLLDYGELDSLTRLLNRKTFEEAFDRLLAAPPGGRAGAAAGERRDEAPEAVPAWLCVVDIDHFKRVNDSYGHVFGDEVLLRMGELLRRTFRGGDRLFRFGGEEFVVLLNAADEALAARSFERFRHSVEEHEFPQVGHVTCSLGFTAVGDDDVPTDVVGRADEALYYAKRNGRNQVCCYERLLSAGTIVRPAAPSHDADIDALFG